MKEDQSPLDVLAGAVVAARAYREAIEEELERTPRWRFRRRGHLERSISSQRAQEQDWIELVKEAASTNRRAGPR